MAHECGVLYRSIRWIVLEGDEYKLMQPGMKVVLSGIKYCPYCGMSLDRAKERRLKEKEEYRKQGLL